MWPDQIPPYPYLHQAAETLALDPYWYPQNLAADPQLPVQLGNGMGSCFAHVWRHVRGGLLDGQHHDGHDDGHTDAGEDSQGTGTDQLVGVLWEYVGGCSAAVGGSLSPQTSPGSPNKPTLSPRWKVEMESRARSCCSSA